MKVIKVEIKQFKVLKDLTATPNGANILLIGDNGVGKSSFIQFIEIALGKTNNIPPGAMGEGVVVTDKAGKQYIFKVDVKDGRAKVTVQAEDGLKDNRRSTLAGICGAMDFNINEFVELSKTDAGRKKQVQIFKSFLPEDIRQGLAVFEANVQANFDERTTLTRRINEISGSIQASPLNHLSDADLSKLQEADTSALMSELQEVTKKNIKRAEVVQRQQEREQQIAGTEKRIEQLQQEIALLEKKKKEDIEKQIQSSAWLRENEHLDPSQIEQQIANAGTINKNFAQGKQLLNDRNTLRNLRQRHEDATINIESQREAIRKTIREMDSPVKGLSFEGEQLFYNGTPVNPGSLSTSEIIELGVRLKMAENPELGILFLEHGESLGEKRLNEILDLCKKNGWQLIMEQVQRGQETLQIELIGTTD